MTNDDKIAFKLSFGCLVVGFILFAATVFVIAAAIKWVSA